MVKPGTTSKPIDIADLDIMDSEEPDNHYFSPHDPAGRSKAYDLIEELICHDCADLFKELS
jgi:hypothetical protein